jgi:hypothetical protein
MTAASLAFRTILSHYLPGLLALPGTYGLVALILRVSGQRVLLRALFSWVNGNPGLASFGFLVLPLLLGILLDTWRHGFRPMREDDKWEEGVRHLSQLPEFLFRFMYDEYYNYAEFEGNGALAGLFDLLAVPYIFLTYGLVWGFSVLIAIALFTTFLWLSWEKSLREFFADLKDTATGYEEILERRAKYGGRHGTQTG